MTDTDAGRTDRPPLLRVKNLKVQFQTDKGLVRAVDDVSFDVFAGETLAIVGESGCGKSVTAMAILRLIPIPPGRIADGQILWDGHDLLQADPRRIRAIRGADIGMIFQEPMTSLNPVYTVGDQITEALILHQGVDRDEAIRLAVDSLRRVGIPDPERRVQEYPHQMSGGMRQRVMIAMALCCYPRLLIADEPTTALDVTIQAQILDLLSALRRQYNQALLLITHDLGVVAETAHRVVVMYAGKVVEQAGVGELFANPRHPYTAGLFHSIPRIDRDDDSLTPIEGMVPDALKFPEGCKFHTRCPYVMDRCRVEEPQLEPQANRTGDGHDHQSACWHARAHGAWDYLGAVRPPAAIADTAPATREDRP